MDYTTYLVHHGIKGMKWGVRRYQNPDGTLTAAGRKRYYNADGTPTRYEKRQRKKLDKKLRKDSSTVVDLFKKHLEEVIELDEAVQNQLQNGLDSDQAIAKSIESRLNALTKDDVFSTSSGNRYFEWYADVQNMTLNEVRVGAGKHRDIDFLNTKVPSKEPKKFVEKLKDFGTWLITEPEGANAEEYDSTLDWLDELIFGRKT